MTEAQKAARAAKISKTKRARTREEIEAEIEKSRQTQIAKFGVDSYSKTAEGKMRIKQVKYEKYGDANYNNKEKNKQTCLERYGVENVFASEEIKEKIKKTNLELYGVENYQKTTEARERARKNYILKKDIILEHTKQACLEKYGVDNYAKTETFKQLTQEKKDIWKEKAISTCMDKYGVAYYAQTEDAAKHRKVALEFEDLYFDSLPELAVYLYALDHSIEIERCPTSFTYIFEEKEHTYFPDFLYDGRLIEVKGDHFFSDGKMINPFDKTQNDLYEAKHQCGLSNGVEF